MYGGRVTDDFDRRVLITYISEYMGDFLFDSNNPFFFAHAREYDYSLPNFESIDDIMMKTQELPLLDEPELFGLNSNSEITYFSNFAKSIWSSLLSMKMVGGQGQNILESQDQLTQIINEIESITPKEFDLVKTKNSLGGVLNPM